MRAILIDHFVQRIEDVVVSNVPEPVVLDGEVLIDIAAAGVNFVDLLYSRGKHQNNRSLVKPPFILGLEFAGTVLSTPQNSKFSPGDRVFGSSIGSYAEQVPVKESSLHKMPDNWTFAEAAGLAATAPVSYGALMLRAELKQGETVLIHAAAGGLGLMAVQIAKSAGARVIATAGSKRKLAVAKSFGADECIDYSSGNWWQTVLKATDGHGVAVVFDPVGLVDKSLKCLKQKGRILVVGFAGTEGKLEKIAMNRVLLRQARVIGYRYGMTDRIDPGETAKIWNELKALWGSELMRPTVFDRSYNGLESVAKAMKDLESREVWGKAVIRMQHASPKL